MHSPGNTQHDLHNHTILCSCIYSGVLLCVNGVHFPELSACFTGWYIVFYKNGIGPPDTHVGATLFIKLDGSEDDEKISKLGAEEGQGERETEESQQPTEEVQRDLTEGEEKGGTNSILVSLHVGKEEEGERNKEASDINRVDEPGLREKVEREALFKSDIATAINTEECRGVCTRSFCATVCTSCH